MRCSKPTSRIQKPRSPSFARQRSPSDLPEKALFASAELWFLQADRDAEQSSYAATAVYAYAFLFPEGDRDPPRSPRSARTHRRGPVQPRAHAGVPTHEGGNARARRQRQDRAAVRPAHGRRPRPRSCTRTGTSCTTCCRWPSSKSTGFRESLPAARYRRATGREDRGRFPASSSRSRSRQRARARDRLGADRFTARGNSQRRAQRPARHGGHARDDDGRDRREQGGARVGADCGIGRGSCGVAVLEEGALPFLGNAIGVRKEGGLVALRPYKATRIPAVFVHGTSVEPGALGEHGQRLPRRLAAPRPLRVLVLQLRLGQSHRATPRFQLRDAPHQGRRAAPIRPARIPASTT